MCPCNSLPWLNSSVASYHLKIKSKFFSMIHKSFRDLAPSYNSFFISCYFTSQTSYKVLHTIYHFTVLFFYSYRFFWQKCWLHIFFNLYVLFLQVSAHFCSWYFLRIPGGLTVPLLCSTALWIFAILSIQYYTEIRDILFLSPPPGCKLPEESSFIFFISALLFHHACNVINVKLNIYIYRTKFFHKTWITEKKTGSI